ncbi:hypothetical protein BBQ08_12225 [Listeria monocytogenes]|nr:hypothetical protein [Listeria monocytogenes]
MDSNFVACFFNVASLTFISFCASSLSIIMKPYPLIIAPHAFSFCEGFVKLFLEKGDKHVFLRP